MEGFQRLRAARSEANLRRKAVTPTPPLPNQPPPPYSSSSKPYDNGTSVGLGIQTHVRPVDEYDGDTGKSNNWTEDHASRLSQRPLMPLPLRIPGRRTPSPAPPTPQTTTQVRHEVQVETQSHGYTHMQMRAETFVSEEVPGLTPSIRARPGAFLSRSRPTSPSPVSLSPATPDSASVVFPPIATEEAAATPAKKNFFKAAADETAFFAGGLISHPAESTKHFTILRHTAGLVMYKGPETSVSISIFSSAPLPTDRTLWLQQRGFSGDKGMRLKTLVGATGSWINVTPVSRVDVSAVPESDERGFQRDGSKWLKKAAKAGGKVGKHVWRETHVVRIPAAAEDGYFRIILCDSSSSSSSDPRAQSTSPYFDDGTDRPPPKKKVLCCSPVFRILSASKDVSVMRGASVATMPLEMGIKVASTVGIVYVSKYTKPVTMAAGAATGAAQSRAATMVASKIKHSAAITKVGKTAYDKSGVHGRLVDANNKYNAEHSAGRYNALGQGSAVFGDNTVGSDEGPDHPFPMKFGAKVVQGTGRSAKELGMPTANLEDVPDDMRQRLRGVYFGWACVQPSGNKKAQPLDERIDPDWHESIITVGVPAHSANPAVVMQRPVVTVHLVDGFGSGVTFFDAKMKVIVMGFLRPTLAGNAALIEQQLHCISMDKMLTVGSLGREAWAPDLAKDQIREVKSSRTFSDRLVGARDKAQMQVDKVPVHLLGVRTEAAGLMDQMHGNGGYWVPR